MRRDEFVSMVGRRFWGWLWKFVILILVVAAGRSSLGDWSEVPSKSMIPAILPGDRIYVNKIAYDLRIPFTSRRLMTWGEPKPGEVVTLVSPRDGLLLVKRVVAGPGDAIDGENGVRVPPGKFYVLGDNREHSIDSRSFGFVDRTQIMGRAVGIIFSLDPDHHSMPRRGRFVEKLR